LEHCRREIFCRFRFTYHFLRAHAGENPMWATRLIWNCASSLVIFIEGLPAFTVRGLVVIGAGFHFHRLRRFDPDIDILRKAVDDRYPFESEVPPFDPTPVCKGEVAVSRLGCPFALQHPVTL